MNRVVVTGLGVVAPNGTTNEGFKESLERGVSGIKFHQHLQDAKMGCQVGGIPDFDEKVIKAYLPQNVIKYLSSQHIKFACTAAINSWLDAGLLIDNETIHWDTGCVIGCSISDICQLREVTRIVDSKELKNLGTRYIEQLMTSGVSAYISGLFGIGNHIQTNSSACATGTESVLLAYERIKYGRCKRMIAGSCEAPSIYVWANFDTMRLLPRKFNDCPEKASRPLSATAGGFVPAGGAGMLVLEDLDTAIKRGARIYAEIMGGAINSGAQRNGGSMTAPNNEGILRCIRQAIESSATDPDSIDLICGHLTATIGDKKEVQNWSTALNRKKDRFPLINSLKCMIGHCLSAAGSIECVAAVMQLYHQFVHPSLNCEDINPGITEIIDGGCIPVKAVSTSINKVIKANFGFGDVNACLVFSKYA